MTRSGGGRTAASFDAPLEAALAEPGGDLRAVAFVDLDHFKPVNDSLGHPVGDALLVRSPSGFVHMRARVLRWLATAVTSS